MVGREGREGGEEWWGGRGQQQKRKKDKKVREREKENIKRCGRSTDKMAREREA